MRDGTASHTARSVAAHRLTFDRPEAPPGGDLAADEALARDVADGLIAAPGRMHDYLRDRTERVARLGLDVAHVTFVAADFTTDDVAARLREAGLEAARPALFTFEGIAVYLDNAVTERVLAQFRQVTPPGSVLAISVSTSAEGAARERFRQWVAAVGEPARSVLALPDAKNLLRRAGWTVQPPAGQPPAGQPPAEGPRQPRAQAAGLLVARAGGT